MAGRARAETTRPAANREQNFQLAARPEASGEAARQRGRPAQVLARRDRRHDPPEREAGDQSGGTVSELS